MIGKFLTSNNPFKPRDAHSTSTPSPFLSPSYSSSCKYTTSNHSTYSNRESISEWNDALVQSLLYGSDSSHKPTTTDDTFHSSTALAHIEPARDIRVAIITDIPFVEYAFFDTHCNKSSPTVTWCDEIPTFHALQDKVFGSSQIKYTGPVTKLHPFPLSDNEASDKSQKKSQQKWLVSRLFRPPSANSPNPDSSSMRVSGPAKANGVSWNSTAPTSAPKASSLADYTCAICVFISAASDSSSCITNCWDELSAALLQLQQTVSARLAQCLPSNYRDFHAYTVGPLPRFLNATGNNAPCCFSVNDDNEINHAVNVFRLRFTSAVQIPRVLCGQNRWSELLRELRWAASYFNRDSKKESFLAKVLTAFITFNEPLLGEQHRITAALGQILGRTVLVGDPVKAQRLIFILSFLIRDPSAPSSPKQPQQQFEDDLHISSETTNLFCPTSTPLPVHGCVGWEIPKSCQPQVAESPSICTMSHVIQPSTTANGSYGSRSISSSLSSRLSAITPTSALHHVAANVFRKAANSLSPSLSFSNSFSSMSALWPSQQRSSGRAGSSADEVLFHSPPPPVVNADDRRLMFSEYEYYSEPAKRATTSTLGDLATLTVNSRSNSTASQSSLAFSLIMDHSSNSGGTQSSVCTSTSYESVPIPEKSAVCLDVPALLDDKEDLFGFCDQQQQQQWYEQPQVPVIQAGTLPAVAGFNEQFHPDFWVQACPKSSNLEAQIMNALADQQQLQYDVAGGSGGSIIIIDVDTMSVNISSTIPLKKEKGEENSNKSPTMSTTSTAISQAEIIRVQRILDRILTNGNENELKMVYESRFDIF